MIYSKDAIDKMVDHACDDKTDSQPDTGMCYGKHEDVLRNRSCSRHVYSVIRYMWI